MKNQNFKFVAFILTSLIFLNLFQLKAQYPQDSLAANIISRQIDGPRFGLTFFLNNTEKMQRATGISKTFMSQFGWHFEHGVYPKNGGPAFVVEYIPMLSGVEDGVFIPSFTIMLGIRTIEGWEFGVGPSITFGDVDGEFTHSSLVIAMGKSFISSGVNIPINLAWVTGKGNNRMSLIIGYAL